MGERPYSGTVYERYKRKELDYSDVTALYGLINSPSMRLAGGNANEFYGKKNLRKQQATELEARDRPEVTPVDLTEVINDYNNKNSGRPDRAA